MSSREIKLGHEGDIDWENFFFIAAATVAIAYLNLTAPTHPEPPHTPTPVDIVEPRMHSISPALKRPGSTLGGLFAETALLE